MGAIPDAWPPPDQPVPQMVVPLFPLPNAWLFPGAVVPLHVFEPRYRQMVEDSLDGPGRLVLAAVPEQHHDQMEGAPPVHMVAGLGEIGRHQRLDDGRYMILLVGLARVLVQEVPSDKLYRMVRVEPLEEVLPAGSQVEDLTDELRAAIRERLGEEVELPEQVPVVHLADLLLLRMPLPHDVLQEIYQEPDVTKRSRRALEEHGIRPIVHPEEPDSDAEGGESDTTPD